MVGLLTLFLMAYVPDTSETEIPGVEITVETNGEETVIELSKEEEEYIDKILDIKGI